MPHDDDKWQAIALLLDNGWPGDFDDAAAGAYRALLAGVEPEEILMALRVLVRKGGSFRPSASEIAGQLNADPGRPTWSEAFRLLFGARGLLSVRPERASIGRATERHPLLGRFIEAEGYDRLTMLPVHDPDWGRRTRRDLERAWDRLTQRADDRHAAGLELDVSPPRRALKPHRPRLPAGVARTGGGSMTSRLLSASAIGALARRRVATYGALPRDEVVSWLERCGVEARACRTRHRPRACPRPAQGNGRRPLSEPCRAHLPP